MRNRRSLSCPAMMRNAFCVQPMLVFLGMSIPTIPALMCSITILLR
ncbi:Uncharacterised protein [Vibrio cholerae]|nr:Uncharacterised protein [Vibrio cholerae]